MLFSKKKSDLKFKYPYGELYAAPYGGMFFHKELIKTIGLPDVKMVLYYDDYEFSHRIIKNKGKIYIIRESIIKDIDKSWHITQSGFAILKIASEKNHVRLYYSIRNRVYFELNNLITKKSEYYINF